MAEQAVIVRFDYLADDLSALQQLEDGLTAAIAAAEAGECDGHDIAADLSNATIYLYGPDADALFAITQPIFEHADCVRGAIATVRSGPPGNDAPERVIQLMRRVG